MPSELEKVFTEEQASAIKKVTEDLASAVELSELKALVKEMGILQKDVIGYLKSVSYNLHELAEAQKRTDERLNTLSQKVEELAEAQRRTEQKVEELAEAQKRTDERLNSLSQKVEELAEAQRRTEQKVEELADAQRRTEQKVEELAEAQRRTEQKVEELAEAQKRTDERLNSLSQKVEELAEAQRRTEQTMHEGFKKVHRSITRLGSRWGIYNEKTFRALVRGILKKHGYKVSEGYYGDRQIDIIIRNGEHILIEITAALRKKNIHNLIKSAKDYMQKEKVQPRLMLAAPHMSPRLYEEVQKQELPIELFTYDLEEELDDDWDWE